MFAVAPVFTSNFHMPAKRKNRSPHQTGISISPADKKTRNNSEENASSSDVVLDALNMAESVTAKLDRIMERLETLHGAEWPDIINIHTTLSTH